MLLSAGIAVAGVCVFCVFVFVCVCVFFFGAMLLVRDRFPGLPPPPSEEDDWGFDSMRRTRPVTRGIACSNPALKRRLYDLLDAAVKSAGR